MSFTEKSLVYLSREYRFIPSVGAVGDSANAGGSIQRDDQIISTSNEKTFMYEQVFVADGLTNTFTVTNADGYLPSNVDNIFVARNGQYIGNEFISSLSPTTGTIGLSFIPQADEEITIVWMMQDLPIQSIYQQIFTCDGVSNTFTVTKNNGELPTTYNKMFVYRNGLQLNSNYLSDLTPSSGQFTLTFTPFVNEKIAVVWFDATNTILPYKQSFTADGLTNSFTITKNNGLLSDVKDAILVMRNGQFIDNDYIDSYDVLTGKVILTFTPTNQEKIEIIWFVIS